MKHLDRLKAQLRVHEGIRYKPYKDTVGKLTIGVGRNLDDKGISESEAAILLDNDIREATIMAATLPCFRSLDGTRQAVLVNMVFNMGIYRVKRFRKMLAALDLGDFHEASQEMLDSKWADQVGSRAVELSEQMRTGRWK